MTAYIIRRCLIAIPMLFAISIMTFVLIQLPPGDFLDRKIAMLKKQYGTTAQIPQVDQLRARYGLDKPQWYRYGKWVAGCVHGDFGESFAADKEVSVLIWDRVALTVLISICSMIMTYAIAIPLGIYSATHQYKTADNILTFMAFVGMSLPGFLIALALMVFFFRVFHIPLYNLNSLRYQDAPWDWARIADFLKHLCIPVAVVGLNGTAGLMRIMRGNLLDVLGQPFVQTARAKGLKERVVINKHAVRIAINPIVSGLGMSLPGILAGDAIISLVLGLPTMGPLLLESLLTEDVYLAGTLMMMYAILLIIGNLLADIALAWVDPRIRYE
jgi:peptide/nickel transport system permease protein